MNGKYKKDMDQNIAFRLNVSQFRRKKILDSIMLEKNDAESMLKRKEGNAIRDSFENWMK